MAVPLESVVKQLADSGIVAPGKLENFVPPKANPASVEELVADLVKQSHLTPFQATQVKAGKVRSLILGSYTILDRIGAGGMGQVFKAQHRRMKRVVAIKMLPSALTKDAAALARFEREVEAAAKLEHPNIVTAYDADQANGIHFLVMQYVEGRDLSALVKKDGPFPVGKAVNYILQAARGLEFAHGEGVVHRDIKPANLLLDKKGVVKILDMGLARIDAGGDAATQAELTGTGAVMGTVDYMAPEQALNTKHADQRADIYSLGITLYYLLAGKGAYGGESLMEKLMAHQMQPIPSLQDVQTTVPKLLDVVFKKMVAKKKEDRYQSMGEVVEALEALGFGGSTTNVRNEAASATKLSAEERKELAASAKKKPLSALTDTVASEKTKHLIVKVVGGAFGTIIAPILVFYLIRHLEKKDETPKPPAAVAIAEIATPAAVPGNATSPADGPGKEKSAVAPKPLVAPFNANAARAGQAAWADYLGIAVEQKNSIGMPLVLIPPGEFSMGSTPEQIATVRKVARLKPDDRDSVRLDTEMPAHRVTLTKPFLLAATEVTNDQFEQFVRATGYVTQAEVEASGKPDTLTWRKPGHAVTSDTAVTSVTWIDAVAFCNWLSAKDNLQPCYWPDGSIRDFAGGYRLPTEAEWEYACRAGTTTEFFFGDDAALLEPYAWNGRNSGNRTRDVGQKRPNPFGLYDIHGNVYEWCHDFFATEYHRTAQVDPIGPSTGSTRVRRSGSWIHQDVASRSAYRSGYAQNHRANDHGMRVLRANVSALADTSLAAATTGATAISPTATARDWKTPAFQAWLAATQKLPAEQQIDAVSKKLMELNPGFDGKVTGRYGSGTPSIKNGNVTDWGLFSDAVTDISPLRVLKNLKTLRCGGSREGKGKLSDLTPLQDLPLMLLEIQFTEVSDLSPLMNCQSLTWLDLRGTKVTAATVDAIRKVLPRCDIKLQEPGKTATTQLNQRWNTPAFQQWTKDVSALPAEKQAQAVAKKLQELNPGFDGNVNPKIENGMVTGLDFCTVSVTDLSPVRALTGLKSLTCWGVYVGSGTLTDLSPLAGTKLTALYCQRNPGLVDLTPIENLPLAVLNCSNVPADMSPLAKLPLEQLTCSFQPSLHTPLLQSIKTLKRINDKPVQQFWADLPAEQQLEAVVKELRAKNPKVTSNDPFSGKVVGGKVTELRIASNLVNDISPLSKLRDLSVLHCGGRSGAWCALSDLSPLAGLPVRELWVRFADISDLSPLKGMPLEELHCDTTMVSDLSPLSGLPLKILACHSNNVANLTPLAGISTLESLEIKKTKVTATGVAALQKALPNCKIEGDEPAKAVPGQAAKPWDAPAFQKWVADTQKLPADRQLEAVGKKLKELNPGFDGKLTPNSEGDAVTSLDFSSEHVADISPVRALPKLRTLLCRCTLLGNTPGMLSDLSPLAGLPLTEVTCYGNKVSDLTPLKGMQLTTLNCDHTLVADLAPLAGMPLSKLLIRSTNVTDLSPLQGMSLVSFQASGAPIADLSPLAGMPLARVNLAGNSRLTDLSPLAGMPLEELRCDFTQVANLSPLERCQSLKTLNVTHTKASAASLAALRKALPECTILDDLPK